MSIESLEHMVRNRVRLFLRHTWLVAILGTAVLVAAVWAAITITADTDHLRIAAGPRDVRFVQALSGLLTKQHHSLHLLLVPTSGPTASAEAMSKDQADFAILPSNLDDSLNWPVVAILRQNVMALIVPAPASSKTQSGAASAGAGTDTKAGAKAAAKAKSAKNGKAAKSSKSAKGSKTAKAAKSDDTNDSDDTSDSDDSGDSNKLEKVTQLSGKRVGIVTGSEATRGLLDLILSHYGVPLTKVTVSEVDPKDLTDAIKNNQFDALFVAGAATGQAISSAVTAASQNGVAPSFIAIDQADGIAKRNPAFDSIDIDAGTFGGVPPTPDDSLKSLSFGEYLVARKSFSDSSVASLAKSLYTSRQSLALAMPGEVKIEAPSTDKDADVVSHPGALAYLSDSQQSFFDKYGDDIFYGMLIFPIFGSAIAGIASYLRRDTRTRRLRLLQRVLDLVRKAHAAQSLETIDQLQLDADNLVIAIIHQSEHEEFDETVRMSFAFALDQLRFAIAGRRHAILDHAGADAGTGKGGKAAAA
ncbi:MAG: TAXI family TRAP transporter solute-binding subunit [Xanthobacteraceae bacterium]|jgi:TRAP-type uncharacterized transport system substrate-binding protein